MFEKEVLYIDLQQKAMQMRDIDLIISVESRKGGIGKTTAALCLAKFLNKKNLRLISPLLKQGAFRLCLVIDSIYWKDDFYSVGLFGQIV